LPIEQLLSEAAGASSSRPAGKPSVVPELKPELKRPEPPAMSRSTNISPFAADSARKSGSKPELSAVGSPLSGSREAPTGSANNVVMGSAAPAVVAQAHPEPEPEPFVETQQPVAAAPSADLRSSVLNALESAGQRMLSAMLESGEWQVEGNEVVIKVASSTTVIEMSLGADAKRLIVATASGVLGRPVRLKVISGGVPQSAPRSVGSTNGGGRGRAEQDAVVRRMKEKFGAEIRTIIDYKEKW
jgi:hypothetical protein